MGTTNTLDLNNRVTELEKAVSGGDSNQANKADIATEFNTTTAYTAGCFVYYGSKLYQFNADHAAGALDPSDVVVANVTDQVVSNKAAIDELAESYPADKVMMSDGVTSVEDRLDGMRFYTVNVPDTAINTLWAGSIYYAEITLDAPENLTDKKVIMSFERTREAIIIGWSARIITNGTKISFTMCRADNSGTVSGKLHLIVKD